MTLTGWPDLAAEERPWAEIPAVRWVGLILGGLFLYAAIRMMFGKRK